jgi:hypothetical protein
MRKLSIKSLYAIKKDFLLEKCREILAQPEENMTKEELYTQLNDKIFTIDGFTLEKKENDRNWEILTIFTIENASKNGCKIIFTKERREKKGKTTVLVPSPRVVIVTIIDGTEIRWSISRKFDFANRVLRQFDTLEKEFRDFSIEAEKQEKIRTLSQGGIQTWITSVLKGTSYSYYTEESKNRIDLHIKLKKGMMLTIPIYYKNFQKIMPEILKTIQSYENCFNASSIITIMEKSPTNIQWNTDKDKE